MSWIVDTNILLHCAQPNHPMHPDAVRALRTLLAQPEILFVTPQNIAEFWNVATRPIEHNGLGLTTAQTDEEVKAIETILSILPEIPAIYTEWRRLVVAHDVAGVRVHDARLVAVMNVYDVRNILTFNVDDFKRYSGVRAVHPGAVQSKK